MSSPNHRQKGTLTKPNWPVPFGLLGDRINTNFKLPENSKIIKFQETFQYCCKCVCVESMGWDALETPWNRGVGVGRLEWRWNTVKWESTAVCAKIVNSDWDLVVYSTSYREGILEWEGLGSDSFGGILLLEKEINRKGMMPLSHSSEKTRRERLCKMKRGHQPLLHHYPFTELHFTKLT